MTSGILRVIQMELQEERNLEFLTEYEFREKPMQMDVHLLLCRKKLLAKRKEICYIIK